MLPVLVAAGALFVGLTQLYTDLLWFRSLGYETVFTTMRGSQVAAALVAGLVAAAVTYANLRLALRLAPGGSFPRVMKIEDRYVELPGLQERAREPTSNAAAIANTCSAATPQRT